MIRNKIVPLALSVITAAFCIPAIAHAYMNPYDVLLSSELLLPSQPRETSDRVDRQQRESAVRREREQEEIFAEQNPTDPDEALFLDELENSNFNYDAAPILGEDPAPVDPEFMMMMRTLERIKQNQAQTKMDAQVRQQAFLLLEESGLHGGAPLRNNGLAPTGAGSILAILVILFAVVFTIRRARQSEKLTQAHS